MRRVAGHLRGLTLYKRRPGHIPAKNPGPSERQRASRREKTAFMRARHGVVQSNVVRRSSQHQRPIDSTPARTAARRSRSVGTAIAATCIAREPVRQNVDAPRDSRAGARYQRSTRGACRHAARHRAWRARHAHTVTHQGSLTPTAASTVLVTSTERVTQHACIRPHQGHCSFCRRVLPPFARLGPLRGGP